jgi:hypothetical protein
MSSDTIIGLSGLTVAIIGTWVAIREYSRRHHIEKVFRTITQGYPGDVAKIEESCNWGNTNVRDAVDALNPMPDSEAKQTVMKHLVLASGDTKSAKTVCMALFARLLTVQDAQFHSREIVHPQKDKLQLCIEEARNNPPKPKITPKWKAWIINKIFKINLNQ